MNADIHSTRREKIVLLSSNPAHALAHSFTIQVVMVLLLHIPLAYAMLHSPEVATLHALLVFAAGLLLLVVDNKPYRLVVLLGYLTGSEVLWRMNDATVFWEYGKYALSTLLLMALFRYRLLQSTRRWPIIFFMLLLPSILLVPGLDREDISFNLSGPFSLAVAATFFSGTRLDLSQVKRFLLAMVLPAVGVAFLATHATLSAGAIVFGTESIGTTSGGYGPNQVSSILGLGALAGFLFFFAGERYKVLRFVIILCSMWMLAQAALTFSRGGVFTSLAALLVAVTMLLRNRHARATLIGASLLVMLIWILAVYPALNGYTGGALANRLQETDLSGRNVLVEADLNTFADHPFAGVGPGQSRDYYALILRDSSAHTEFTRWLAEHGSFGLAAMLIFLWILLQRIRDFAPPLDKAIILSFTVWSILFMSHSAMRLVAPSLLFGMAAAEFALDQAAPEKINSTQ